MKIRKGNSDIGSTARCGSRSPSRRRAESRHRRRKRCRSTGAAIARSNPFEMFEHPPFPDRGRLGKRTPSPERRVCKIVHCTHSVDVSWPGRDGHRTETAMTAAHAHEHAATESGSEPVALAREATAAAEALLADAIVRVQGRATGEGRPVNTLR